ncbi:MAG: DUF167 domain-containing protein [Gammaproteobacteria bacterium]
MVKELQIKLTPNSSSNRIVVDDESSANVMSLKIYVTAVPEDGKANAAMLKLLADHFHLPKSSFKLVRGQKNRNKVVHIIQ